MGYDNAGSMERALRAAVKECGCTLLSITKKRGHYKLRVKLPSGRALNFTASSTPRCRHHAIDNFQHDIRRAEREETTP